VDVVERLTLEAAAADTLLALEHRHRYELAAELLAGSRVLDLCCGSGYGTALLGATAVAVTGVDRDAASIDMARSRFEGEAKLEFQCMDALSYLRSRATEEFDAIVCFEGLEHLDDIEAVLERLRELAARGTRLLLSVPNSKLFDEENEHHRSQFGYEEALAAMKGFPAPLLLPQYLAEGSLIVPPGATKAAEPQIALRGGAEPEHANHLLFAINLSADELLAAAHGRLQLTAAPRHNAYVRRLEWLNDRLWRENARLARERIGKAGAAAASHLVKVRAREQELTAELLECGDRLHEARVEAAELALQLSDLRARRSPPRWVARWLWRRLRAARERKAQD
jgi:SAM-dependent methyltransferase